MAVESGSYPKRVLQLTDTHLFGSATGTLLGVSTEATLYDVIDLALARKGIPDAVILTGDLSQDESAQSYARLKELVSRLPCPKYSLPGNHDRPDVMGSVFAGGASEISGAKDFALGNWRLIMLDSTVAGQVGGMLSESELESLSRLLDEHRDEHVAVCLHHQPIEMQCRWIDAIGLANAGSFWSIIDSFANVRAVIWGHIHQQFDGRRNGVALMASPSTCVQFMPRTDDFQVDATPPGFRWFELYENGSLRTEVLRLSSLPAGLRAGSGGY